MQGFWCVVEAIVQAFFVDARGKSEFLFSHKKANDLAGSWHIKSIDNAEIHSHSLFYDGFDELKICVISTSSHNRAVIDLQNSRHVSVTCQGSIRPQLVCRDGDPTVKLHTKHWRASYNGLSEKQIDEDTTKVFAFYSQTTEAQVPSTHRKVHLAAGLPWPHHLLDCGMWSLLAIIPYYHDWFEALDPNVESIWA